MERYRPTPEEIVSAKNGSNELFEKDVEHHLKPNHLRNSNNLTGLNYQSWRGVLYINGVPQQSKGKPTSGKLKTQGRIFEGISEGISEGR